MQNKNKLNCKFFQGIETVVYELNWHETNLKSMKR